AEDAAAIGGTDDDGLDPGRGGLLDRHVGEAKISLATRQPELAAADLRAPEGDAVGGLGGELVGGVADEQQVGSAQAHRLNPFLVRALLAAILGKCGRRRKSQPFALRMAAIRAPTLGIGAARLSYRFRATAS